MNGAWLGWKYVLFASKTDQTVEPARAGSCFSRHSNVVPPHDWTSMPSRSRYHSSSRALSRALKNTPPRPVTLRMALSSNGLRLSDAKDEIASHRRPARRRRGEAHQVRPVLELAERQIELIAGGPSGAEGVGGKGRRGVHEFAVVDVEHLHGDVDGSQRRVAALKHTDESGDVVASAEVACGGRNDRQHAHERVRPRHGCALA